MVEPHKELNKALGIVTDVEILQTKPWNNKDTSEEQSVTVVEESPIVSAEEVGEIEQDYLYQRNTFYALVEKGSTAIDGILEIAKEGEHPRGYEVAGNLIKQVAEVTEKLGELQEKMKRLKEVPNNAPKNVTNALFVGSTAELQKMLKGK